MAGSLVGRVLAGWGGVRASFRAERDATPREAQLLFYAMLACLLFFIARLPAVMADLPPAIAGDPDTRAAYLGAQVVASVLFGPLMLYGVAGLAHLGARAVGGRASWADARLALFWALLLGAPLMLVAGAAASVARMAGAPGLAAAAAIAPFGVLWLWAVCLAEAEGFARPVPVFAGLLVLPVCAMGLLYLARAGA